MAREKTQTGTQSTGTITDKTPVEVVYVDDSPNEWYEDYEIISGGWMKLISLDDPGHAEHGISSVVPARRIEELVFYDD